MIILSPELARGAARASTELPEEPLDSDESVARLHASSSRDETLRRIASLARAVLDEQGFVQVRGIEGPEARRFFPTLATLLGSPYIDPAEGSAVIGAHVRPNEALMGNQLRHLPLHTDYSMLANPPRLTMSLCLQADRLPGWGALLVADIEAMCFGIESEPEIHRFTSVSLPFAGRNAQNSIDIFQSPIVSRNDGKFVVRYHRSRIRQGFRAGNSMPTAEQSATMMAFERCAGAFVQTLHPEAGDITVIDNHRTVHARTRCSVVVEADGSTRGRQMEFLFAY